MARRISDLLTKKKRSNIVKKARHGHDFGKSNKKSGGFSKLVNKLESQGHSSKGARKIAGSQFWKQEARK